MTRAVHRWSIVAAAIALAIGAASCILGPKQDDPAGSDNTGLDATSGSDTGTGFKTDTAGGGADTSPPPPSDTGVFGVDAAADTPAVPPDGASDAPGGDTSSFDTSPVDADAGADAPATDADAPESLPSD